MSNINVVILAGGVSSRFWPLSEKNIYTFFGHTPFDYHLERIQKLKPKKVIIVTNDKIKVEFTGAESVVQKGLGMAGGISTALEKIDLNEEVLIIGANDYYDSSLFEVLDQKRGELKNSGCCAMAASKVKSYFPGGYIKLDGDDIKGIVEKPSPDNTPSDYVNMVFHYFYNARIIADALKKAVSNNDDLYEVAIDNLIKSNTRFKLVEYKGEWKTIKYPWHVLEVMRYFLNQIKTPQISQNTNISDKAVIKGNVIIEDGVKIFEGAIINGPAFIGKNTIIANNALVRESMIGENCVIGFSSEVARSYFKNDVWLHKNYVGDSIFESNISLGSGTVTGNLRLDEQPLDIKVKGKKISTEKNKLGVIIGSNVRIGINTSIMPGIRIGSGSFIGPAIMLDRDVPENTFVKTTPTYKFTKNKFDITKIFGGREEAKKILK